MGIACRAAFLLLILTAPAGADEAKSPSDLAVLKMQNTVIVAKEPKATGVFVVQDDGAVHHVQSGLTCPAKYPNVRFFHILVYVADGTDVGCDYWRPDDKGGASSKLTIFAVKATPEMTLDVAFAKYRQEVVDTWKGAKSLGLAIEVTNKSAAPSAMPEIRSEEFLIPLNETTYTTDVVVAVTAGWVVEIRSTYVGQPNAIEITKDSGPDAAVLAGGDRVMGPKALFDALGSIGK